MNNEEAVYVYSLINYQQAYMVHGIELRDGTEEVLDYMVFPHKQHPLSTGYSIATGVFDDDCVVKHLTQEEAEAIVAREATQHDA